MSCKGGKITVHGPNPACHLFCIAYEQRVFVIFQIVEKIMGRLINIMTCEVFMKLKLLLQVMFYWNMTVFFTCLWFLSYNDRVEQCVRENMGAKLKMFNIWTLLEKVC